jgi:transcriptional regulator
MYIPPHFEQKDRGAALALIAENPFGLLVTAGDSAAPFASHLPFLIEERGGEAVLVAHMARANPQWRAFDGATEALAVFQGPHGYISPGWYASGNRVPTWNYIAVHVTGAPRILDGDAARGALAALAAAFESRLAAPWKMDGLPDEAVARMLAAIVAFELPASRIEGKWKLGQNMSEADRAGAAAGVEREGGDPALARLMRP